MPKRSAKHLKRQLYKHLCEKHGSQHMGNFNQFHPLTYKILNESIIGDQAYNQYMASAAESLNLPAEKLKKIVTQDMFKEYMTAFAAGIQYAAANINEDIDIKNYEFQHDLKKYEIDFDHFYAAAVYHPPEDEQQSDPVIILSPILIPTLPENQVEQFEYVGAEGEFRLKEIATLAGVEEMVHMHQLLNRDARPSYDLEKNENSAKIEGYEDDPNELEAKKMVTQAAKDLGLGSENRSRSK